MLKETSFRYCWTFKSRNSPKFVLTGPWLRLARAVWALICNDWHIRPCRSNVSIELDKDYVIAPSIDWVYLGHVVALPLIQLVFFFVCLFFFSNTMGIEEFRIELNKLSGNYSAGERMACTVHIQTTSKQNISGSGITQPTKLQWNNDSNLVWKGIQLTVLGKAEVNLTDEDNNMYRSTETYLKVQTPLRSPGKTHSTWRWWRNPSCLCLCRRWSDLLLTSWKTCFSFLPQVTRGTGAIFPHVPRSIWKYQL